MQHPLTSELDNSAEQLLKEEASCIEEHASEGDSEASDDEVVCRAAFNNSSTLKDSLNDQV